MNTARHLCQPVYPSPAKNMPGLMHGYLTQCFEFPSTIWLFSPVATLIR
jgi:hypothetical protein